MIAKNDKVVCIVDFKVAGEHIHPNGVPIKDRIYNVNELFLDSSGVLGLILTGVPSIASTGRDVGYISSGFKKIIDAQTDNKLIKLKQERV
jgi:hypothetical protein